MNTVNTSLKAVITTPETSHRIKPFGLDMQVLLSTEASGGGTSVVVANHKPGEGPPDHFHTSQEELIFILEGTYEVTIDTQTTIAGADTLLFIPRNVVHRFKNIGETTGRMLDWSLPGGQDHYFQAISDLAAAGTFTSHKALELSKTFDTNFPDRK